MESLEIREMKAGNKKKVLVTGGTGFIGSHLVEGLLERNYEVVVLDVQLDARSLFVINKHHKKTILEIADVRDRNEIEEVLLTHQPEYVFHLAAQTIVTTAYQNPRETLETNILGTINILESMRKFDFIKGMIFASSDKAYGKSDVAYTEDFPLKGDHPYDVSKSSADLIVQTYFKTYQLPVVIARFGNVYGEGDLHFNRIIPGICESFITNKPLLIRSNGKYVRDYLYVKDVVEGYLLLLASLENNKGEAFNFSSPEKMSVLKLVSLSEKVLKRKIQYEIQNNVQNEIPYQHLEDAKVKKLGWKNNYSIESTLPAIVDWYRKIL